VGGTFVITLREGFEAALVLGLIYTYLDKIGARREFRYVTTGAVVGVAASLVLGVMVTLLSGPLVDLGPDLIGAAVLFAASGTLTWHGWWMRQHARAVRGELEQRIDAAHARQQFWVVGVIAFTGVFREGAETVLFLWGLLTQIGTHAGGALLAVGGLLGVVGAKSNRSLENIYCIFQFLEPYQAHSIGMQGSRLSIENRTGLREVSGGFGAIPFPVVNDTQHGVANRIVRTQFQ